MKKLMIMVAAMAAFGAAVPASAQYGGQSYRGPDWGPGWDRNFRGPNYDNRIDRLEAQIQRGIQRGTISYREARSLREDVRKLERIERDYSRGGFTRSERDRLERRIDNLREKIDRAERNGRGRDDWRDGRRW